MIGVRAPVAGARGRLALAAASSADLGAHRRRTRGAAGAMTHRLHEPLDGRAVGVVGTELGPLVGVEAALEQRPEDGRLDERPVEAAGLQQRGDLVAGELQDIGVGEQAAVEPVDAVDAEVAAALSAMLPEQGAAAARRSRPGGARWPRPAARAGPWAGRGRPRRRGRTGACRGSGPRARARAPRARSETARAAKRPAASSVSSSAASRGRSSSGSLHERVEDAQRLRRVGARGRSA